jgi:hypothetical protein
MAGGKLCSAPHDLLKGRTFGSGREFAIKGGISGFGQVRADYWMVQKPRPEALVRGQVVAPVAEAKLMRGGVISEL